jgi:hypothetical protein
MTIKSFSEYVFSSVISTGGKNFISGIVAWRISRKYIVNKFGLIKNCDMSNMLECFKSSFQTIDILHKV